MASALESPSGSIGSKGGSASSSGSPGAASAGGGGEGGYTPFTFDESTTKLLGKLNASIVNGYAKLINGDKALRLTITKPVRAACSAAGLMALDSFLMRIIKWGARGTNITLAATTPMLFYLEGVNGPSDDPQVSEAGERLVEHAAKADAAFEETGDSALRDLLPDPRKKAFIEGKPLRNPVDSIGDAVSQRARRLYLTYSDVTLKKETLKKGLTETIASMVEDGAQAELIEEKRSALDELEEKIKSGRGKYYFDRKRFVEQEYGLMVPPQIISLYQAARDVQVQSTASPILYTFICAFYHRLFSAIVEKLAQSLASIEQTGKKRSVKVGQDVVMAILSADGSDTEDLHQLFEDWRGEGWREELHDLTTSFIEELERDAEEKRLARQKKKEERERADREAAAAAGSAEDEDAGEAGADDSKAASSSGDGDGEDGAVEGDDDESPVKPAKKGRVAKRGRGRAAGRAKRGRRAAATAEEGEDE